MSTSKTFKLEDIPLGTCCKCNKKQTKATEDGYWNTMKSKEWICHDCKYKHNIKLYPMACEWCTYDDVKWCQGHTYRCPRCHYFKIGNYIG